MTDEHYKIKEGLARLEDAINIMYHIPGDRLPMA